MQEKLEQLKRLWKTTMIGILGRTNDQNISIMCNNFSQQLQEVITSEAKREIKIDELINEK